jgi:intein/homing endonuclease
LIFSANAQAQVVKDPFGGHIPDRTVGCVTSDTLITIDDGSAVQIDRMRANQMVLSAGDEKVVVTYVTAGPEKELMYKITTRSGKSITATKGHPFYGTQGLKLASEFSVGDDIVTAQGLEKVFSIETVSYVGKVFNLIVGSTNLIATAFQSSWAEVRRLDPLFGLPVRKHTVVLNGFVSGDLSLQLLITK